MHSFPSRRPSRADFYAHCIRVPRWAVRARRRSRHLLMWCLLAGTVVCQADPGDLWLQQYGLMPWQWDLDLDFDGLTVIQEYALGGDPFGEDPRHMLELSHSSPGLALAWDAIPGQRFQVVESADLETFFDYGPPVLTLDARFLMDVDPSLQQQFFHLTILPPVDRDGDGLSDLEEELISGTSPVLPDTDGDSVSDDTEALQHLGDPLVPVTEGGRIEGTVRTDPNGDGDVSDGAPVAGARVHLDLDFDGAFGSDDAWMATDADGAYAFGPLPPGLYAVRQDLPTATWQTLPEVGAQPVGDGLADELVEYHHTLTGSFPVPYGGMADEFAAFSYILFPAEPEPVDPLLVLKPIGRRADTPAVGAFPWSEWLTMPQDSTLLLRYDEWIIDGPGDDVLIYSVDASANERVEVAVGPTSNRRTTWMSMIRAGQGPTGSALPKGRGPWRTACWDPWMQPG